MACESHVVVLVSVWKPQIMGSPQLVGGDFVCQVGDPPNKFGTRLPNWGSTCVSRQELAYT